MWYNYFAQYIISNNYLLNLLLSGGVHIERAAGLDISILTDELVICGGVFMKIKADLMGLNKSAVQAQMCLNIYYNLSQPK